MRCVTIKPNPNDRGLKRELIPDDIEEVATIIRLRQEALDLHVGFSLAESLSKLTSEAKA